MRSSRHPQDRDNSAQPAEPPTENEDFEAVAGGFLFTALADADAAAPTLTLTEPLAARSTHFSLSVPPERIPPGQIYMLGSPGTPTCEVVQVGESAAAPGRPRPIRRALFGTVVMSHPAGTPVTAISVERVDDWDQWDQRGE